jgi:hypothetical protein
MDLTMGTPENREGDAKIRLTRRRRGRPKTQEDYQDRAMTTGKTLQSEK